ncbi:hypothetical protein ACS0TY_019308 [Phlomoides rotata]
MKVELKRLMDEFHRNGRIVRGLNTPFIVLIPKKESPQRLDDYRPILLISGVYKIIAKILFSRIAKDGDSLWARVVRSRWGKSWRFFERKGVRRRGTKPGGWWGEILKTVGDHNGWFFGGLERVVGEGEETGFWDDVWIEGVRLRERFPRLFQLSLGKGDSVSSFGSWGENGYTPKQGVKDTWKWNRAPDGTYSTKAAYELIMRSKEGEVHLELEEFKLIWNSFSPTKVRMHAWRILWERIPTTTKLIRHNAISPNTSTTFSFCEQETETVSKREERKANQRKHLGMSCLDIMESEEYVSLP